MNNPKIEAGQLPQLIPAEPLVEPEQTHPRPNVLRRLGGVAARFIPGLQKPDHNNQLVHNQDMVVAAANAAWGVAEGVVAATRKAGGAALDAVHNITDWAAYAYRLKLINHLAPDELRAQIAPRANERRFGYLSRLGGLFSPSGGENVNVAKLEKRSYGFTFVPALGAAALSSYAAVDAFFNPSKEGGIGMADLTHSAVGVGALTVALALLKSANRMDKVIDAAQEKGTEINTELRRHIKNLRDHARIDSVTSGFVTVESFFHMAGSAGSAVSSLVVAGLSGVLAWRFRMTKRNMHGEHNHAAEDNAGHSHHGHGEHDHSNHNHSGHSHDDNCGHIVSHGLLERASRLSGRQKVLAGIGAIGLSALAVLGVEKLQEAALPAEGSSVGISDISFGTVEQEVPPPLAEKPANDVIDTDVDVFSPACTEVKSGDTQWQLVQNQLQQVSGEEPAIALTNAVTILTAQANQDTVPSPDELQPGDCLNLPSEEVLKILTDAQPNSQLGKALDEFNSFSDWDKAMNAHVSNQEMIKLLKAELLQTAN